MVIMALMLYRAEQSRAEQSRAEQSRAEQSRAEQSRAEQSRAEQSRAEQSRAELLLRLVKANVQTKALTVCQKIDVIIKTDKNDEKI